MRPEQILTEKLIRDGVVEQENREVILYGLEAVTSNVIALLITVAVGACFGGGTEGFILWCFIFPLRKSAGGYHAKTKMRCTIVSMGMLLLAFWSLFATEWSMKAYMLMGSGFGLLIFLLAPIGNANKQLDLEELRVYRKQTRWIMAIESALLLAAYIVPWRQLVKIIVMGFAIVGCVLVAGKIKLWVEQKRNETKNILQI